MISANAQWAQDVESAHPGFFLQSARGQSPHTLWIGCSDSRVPESVVTGAMPGAIFVNRNIGNQVHLHDDNVLAVLTFAVGTLRVKHVVVCGHTECGAVAGCVAPPPNSVEYPITDEAHSDALNRWLAPLNALARDQGIYDVPTLTRVNVQEQVNNLCKTDVIKNAEVWVHGWVYDVSQGRIRDLGISRGPNSKDV
ncbi:hypothetical protein GYMLUDRAFT_204879 [Collybiopsis luxurians FD-317 M1]|uniref:Carbonic anhydrase n=1 Tax=Collybiopsis luxurians FD-317 M1 TaxID=944289 RepID=A0A0D0CM05_9AGAR|nr:hypothetical protein GYMLUDRAFT_204879 [Collybiopsis luxurians FD-317 M1]